jgi:hypothetical protein
MARLTPNFDRLDPTIPRVKERVPIKIPTIDQLVRPAPPRPWWELLPSPPPSKDPTPYAPVPIIPPPPPPPLEVDPPSRPPEWLFGPPYISRTPAQVPSPGPVYPQFVPPDNFMAGGLEERLAALNGGLPTTARNPWPPSRVFDTGTSPIPYLPLASQEAPRGLPALLAEIDAFDSSNSEAPPSGGLPGLIQEYLRNR